MDAFIGTILVIVALWFLAAIVRRLRQIAVERRVIEAERLRLVTKRFELLQKYNDDERVVEGILNHEIWEGMTESQLLDSQGHPVEKAIRRMKKVTTETFKYQKVGKNRFMVRVVLENGIVVGWEQH